VINHFKTIIFDCDGVILNSNKVKKIAYFKVTSSYYGDKCAKSLIEYLEKNTGKPREHFFTHFFNNIVPSDSVGPNVEELIKEVGEEIHKGLMECEISQSLFTLRDNSPETNWIVVSGGVQSELRDIFTNRSLVDLFDGGIFGGPMTKDEILKSLFKNDSIKLPAIYLGDSKFDFEVSSRFNLDFLFISEWTNFKDWKNYCYNNNISSVKSLAALL
tara:strand:- start:588 stop:1235 length:648 start_codon:yes stop_codon:yes gene_type:complete